MSVDVVIHKENGMVLDQLDPSLYKFVLVKRRLDLLEVKDYMVL